MDVLEVCINHLVLDTKQTSVREMLPLRQTCKHLCDFVGDFLTTLNFSIKDSNGQYWNYNDAYERIYYPPSFPSEFRLRRIKKVVFGGRLLPHDVQLGITLGTAVRKFDWNIEAVEVRLVDMRQNEDSWSIERDYQTAHCSETATAFLGQLHNLPALTIGTSRWGEDLYFFTPETAVSFVDVSGVRLLTNCAARVPGLRSLNLQGVLDLEGVIPALVAAPSSLWAALREISISHGKVDDVLAAAVPHLTQLRTLNLISCTIGNRASDALLHEPALHELRVLNMAYLSKVKDACLVRRNEFASLKSQTSFLRAMQRCVLLEELWLHIERIDDQALLELLESLHHLRVLAVHSSCQSFICSEKIARIVVDWPQLEMLFLDGIFETDDNIGAARILGSATRLSRLRVLSTTWNDSTCVEAFLGGSASWLDTVEELQLEKPLGRRGTEGCVSALIRAAPRLRSLKGLGITRVDETALMEIRRVMPTVKVLPWCHPWSSFYSV